MRTLPYLLLAIVSLSFGCSSSTSSNGDAPEAAPPATDSIATGTVLRGPLIVGYESIPASDPDAKQAVESGGVFLRKKGDKEGPVIGVGAMPDLPVDPTVAEICTAASTAMAKDRGASLTSAAVVAVGTTKACRADLTAPESTLVSRSFTWLLDPASRLGAMVVCAFDATDKAAAAACEKFVQGVEPKR